MLISVIGSYNYSLFEHLANKMYSSHDTKVKGDFSKAIELYRQVLKLGQNGNELSKSLKDDFEYFRDEGSTIL